MDPIGIAMLLGGIVVLAVVTTDFLFTTVGSAGRLTISDGIARGVFGALRALSRAGLNGILTEISGVIVMVAVALFWILGSLLGWALIYASTPGPVVMGPIGIEPEAIDYASHVGHLLGTLGGT